MTWTKKNGTSDIRAYASKKEMFEASDILKERTDITECYWTSIDDIETKNYIIKKEETKTKESTRKAIKKYNEKFDEIKIRVPRGMKEEIKYLAARNRLSMNEFIQSLIEYARYCDEVKKIEEEKRDREDAANDIIPEY